MILKNIFEMKTFFPNSNLIGNNCLQSTAGIEDSFLFIRNGKLQLGSKSN